MSYLIDDHLQHLRAAGKSELTIGARHDVLWRVHNYLPMGLAYACAEQLEAWLAHPGWSRWTRRTYANHLSGFYLWATVNEYLDGNPMGRIDRPKSPRCIPRPVTDEELARALECREPLRTAIMFAALGGYRRSEIAQARREHITQESMLIPVGKGGDAGSVPTHPDLWSHIRDRPIGLLFLDDWGRPVTGRWITALARREFHALGMPDVTMHRFRHWYGTMIQRTYGDIRVTQDCLRHANISSTQGYTKVTDEQRTRAVAALALPKAGPASL